MPSITSSGITIETINDVIDFLTNGYKSIYGNDINIDQNTPDGQLIGIHAKLNADIQESLVALYNSFDPDLAVGHALRKIIKLSGLTGNPATRSTVTLTMILSQPMAFPSDYTVKDTLNQEWVIDTAIDLLAGTFSIGFHAKEWGAVTASINTITVPVTILEGITSFTNPAIASIGIDEETDIALRQRRGRSVEKPSKSTLGGLIAGLLDLKGVTDVAVYENKTNAYDAVYALNEHSIWAIVDGGVTADIIKTMVQEKTGGTSLKGVTTGSYIETFTRADLSIFTYTHTSQFDRPNIINPYIRLTATTITGTTDPVLIKNAIALKTFRIGEDITITALYAYVYQAGTNFIASALEASYDGVTWVSTILNAGYSDKFAITTARLMVTVI